ncbi:MAG: hypothetical protein OEM03_10380, partial [Chromatiales bacterium]|nr:hypothetical protein [Chromatiales bacterium]
MTSDSPDNGNETAAPPLLAPSRDIDIMAPLGWLKKGWSDMRRAPRQSLSYGIAVTALSYLVSLLALGLGSWVIFLAL